MTTTPLTLDGLETAYDALATAIDQAGPQRSEVMLVKLALLQAQVTLAALAPTGSFTIGWNGYSAIRPRPDARPNRRRFSAAFFDVVKRNSPSATPTTM